MDLQVGTNNWEDEDEGSMFLQNAGTHLQVHMVSQTRRPPWTPSLLSTSNIIYIAEVIKDE
jgi:hypothetical protein